ncbi:MAG: AEC family transporter [Pseudomonadota bacterium]
MNALLDVIVPVFIVIGAGYLAVWRGYFSDAAVDTLTLFAQRFAIPVLLFQAIAGLDLSQVLSWPLLLSFYIGALAGFAAGLFGARFLFGRPWEDSVAIGFVGLFSNSVLLGLPITERAYGADVLSFTYAIIAFHAPFCYALGITVMEIVRAEGKGPLGIARAAANAMYRNALIVAIAAGFVVNLTGLPLPGPVADAVEIVSVAALPTALFGLGGVLVRYRPDGELRIVFYLCAVSLVLHPALAFALGTVFGLTQDAIRAAVLTGAMAPGVNSFIFASMYGVGKRVAATTVLLATALSILSVWLWLLILG